MSSFAEQMIVHENALVKIPDEMPLDLAALIGCGVITGYGAVTRSAAIEAGSTVAIFGVGGIGLAAINAAQLAGARSIIAIDRDTSKFAIARQFGATETIDATIDDVVAKIVELSSGGVRYSFECVGLKITAEQSFACLRPGGLATVIGMIPFGTKIELHGFDLPRQRRLQGSAMKKGGVARSVIMFEH